MVAQAPNAAITVFVGSLLLRWSGVLDDDVETKVRYVGTGALIVWAADEVFRGASPFRRVLGAVVLAFQLVRLFG